MAASVNDYFQKLGGASSLVNTPKVTATRAPAGTTLTVDNCNWDTTTGKRFATFQVDTSGAVVSGTETIWKGVVSSTTSIGSLARVAGAADTGNAIGDYVMLLPASDWGNQIVTGLLVEHTQTGTHTLSASSTLTSSKFITSLNDTNGNELAKVTATASAVNEVTLANAATGNAPSITASGDDANVALKLSGKGTGAIQMFVNSVDQLGAWIDYSATSTVGGFSAFTVKKIAYRQIGKTVNVAYSISGTSNAGTLTFTVPAAASTSMDLWQQACGKTVNNGAIDTVHASAYIDTGVNASLINILRTSGVFTASGTKTATGILTYEAA